MPSCDDVPLNQAPRARPPVPAAPSLPPLATPAFTVEAIVAVGRIFNDRHLHYLVVGGLAVVAHGGMRLTYDVDLAVDFAGDNAQRCVGALTELGYRSRAPVPMASFCDATTRRTWAETKDMVAFSVWKDQDGIQTSEIDLLLTFPGDFATAFQRAVWKPVTALGDVVLPFVDRDTLIAMKTQAGRPKDLADVALLRGIGDSYEPA